MKLLSHFKWSGGITLLALVGALFFGGWETAFIVAVLCILEISLSFDNSVVNAKILRTMPPVWQKLFLTVGILFAVFFMRLAFPVILVAITAGLGIDSVIDLALNDQAAYGAALEHAGPSIFAFGGMFLFMIFLDMFLDEDKDVHWFGPIERAMSRLGGLGGASVIIALAALASVSRFVHAEDATTVLFSGVVGVVVYLLVSGLDDLMEGKMEEDSSGNAVGAVAKNGLAGFLYLELIDASFSFDGVIGAFSISNDIFIIALGLGVGAFWIRSLTVYFVRQRTLEAYIYLEHGAHWAIGALAAIMLVKTTGAHVPEVITGVIGVGFIIVAVLSSIAYKKKHGSEEVELEKV